MHEITDEMEDSLYNDLYDKDNEYPEISEDDVVLADTNEFEEDEEFSSFDEEEFEGAPKQVAPELTGNILEDFLKSKGIEDINKIQYEDEEGNIQEVSFYDLPVEDQLGILQSSDADLNYGLTDDEIQTVNFLRSNNASLEEVIEYVKRQAVEEYLRGSVSENFSIDNISDEELFVLDLKSKYEDLTEDELQIELDKEIANRDLFNKKISKIRQEYIELEAERIELEKQQALEEENVKYEELTSKLVDVALKVEDIGGLDLTDDDKNDVLDYILTKDVNGVSNFVKNLDNNEMLFKMAWFAVKGEEAFTVLHDYYKNQIEQVRKNTYQKAFEEFQKTSKTTVINPPKTATSKGTPYNRYGGETTIDDLYN